MPRTEKCALCETEKVHYLEAKLCYNCYAFVYYWKKRSVTDLMKRFQQLDRWMTRTTKIMPPKVSPIKKKKPKRGKAA